MRTLLSPSKIAQLRVASTIAFLVEQMRKNAERGNEVRGPVRRRKAHLMVFYKVKIRGDWFAA
jgi:hypothetical protein